MKHRILITAVLALTLGAALPASAECYADYKAKQARPLRLHYGVIKLPDDICDDRRAAAEFIESHLERNGWQLLNVMSLFDRDGLAERKVSAGKFFLRY
ncbi:hypothetical protein [Actibacterium sp.]|uniref:hypothetical protein n=1 Tax=Actibacterium sp. TaxID=1872125 RepID=UPI00356AE648